MSTLCASGVTGSPWTDWRDWPISHARGDPRVFTDLQAAEVEAMACELPAESGLPLSRWSSTDLATEAVARGIVEAISAATVRRWLDTDAIKPWQHRSWISPATPTSRPKPAGSSTSTPAPGKASRWAMTST